MPKLKPLQEWICDTCGEPVSIEDGWLEWLEFPKLGPRDFHIVHHRNKCQQHIRARDVADTHIAQFLGPEGLQCLLAMLDLGRILDPRAERLPPQPDLPSFVDVFRRLQIPYYEEARRYFADARGDYFAQYNENTTLMPETCKAIIERYE